MDHPLWAGSIVSDQNKDRGMSVYINMLLVFHLLIAVSDFRLSKNVIFNPSIMKLLYSNAKLV